MERTLHRKALSLAAVVAAFVTIGLPVPTEGKASTKLFRSHL